MNSIILFLLKSILVSAILTAWYCLGLKNKKLHNYNRFFLLFILYASIQLPLLHFQWFSIHKAASIAASPGTFLLQVINDNVANEQRLVRHVPFAALSWNTIVLIVTAMISFSLLAVLLVRIGWIIRMSRKYPATHLEDITLFRTNLAKAPFSFLSYLFWKDAIALDSENGRLIYRHELTHIKQKHTYDKLACQVLTCIFWMNPFYWFIQKELNMIHEFIADEAALGENDTEAFANMLLQTHNNGLYLVPQHQFFSSPIKRRLTMLQTSRKTSYAWFRRLAVLPLLTCSLLIFSFTPRKEMKHESVKAAKKIVLVVDPGHGGADEGGRFGFLTEKELNLKIASRINEISPEYNIEVHLTRNKDETVSLQDRVDISNKFHPDYFVSIHISDEPNKDISKGNFNVFISTRNPKMEESRKLGWTIGKELIGTGATQNNDLSLESKGLYILRNNNVPGVLVSLGDIKNKAQMQQLSNDAQLDELCSAILKGVVDFNKN